MQQQITVTSWNGSTFGESETEEWFAGAGWSDWLAEHNYCEECEEPEGAGASTDWPAGKGRWCRWNRGDGEYAYCYVVVSIEPRPEHEPRRPAGPEPRPEHVHTFRPVNVTCPACDGTGRIPLPAYAGPGAFPCPVCSGALWPA
ncbi:MAG: hypothetical protein GF320_21950 [Armatimonadia bacterium]|nr:hypothetical protein [Armatimonadia bacterium]